MDRMLLDQQTSGDLVDKMCPHIERQRSSLRVPIYIER